MQLTVNLFLSNCCSVRPVQSRRTRRKSWKKTSRCVEFLWLRLVVNFFLEIEHVLVQSLPVFKNAVQKLFPWYYMIEFYYLPGKWQSLKLCVTCPVVIIISKVLYLQRLLRCLDDVG